MDGQWKALKRQMDLWVDQFQTSAFLEQDPIQVPHRFRKKQDIEIMALFAAVLAWGQRSVIVRKALQLAHLMDDAPHDFILHHNESDKKPLMQFKHRTFQPIDLMYFLEFLQWWYRQHPSLEPAFTTHLPDNAPHVGPALANFHKLFFSLPHAPKRTKKHMPTPVSGSSCKRLNMFLRWMVRSAEKGVDFGLWKDICPSQLLIPLDVHVHRVAQQLGLLQRPKPDWKAVIELTEVLRLFDPSDPAKYDFALFGLGVLSKNDLKPRY